jgi:hypothetical protein
MYRCRRSGHRAGAISGERYIRNISAPCDRSPNVRRARILALKERPSVFLDHAGIANVDNKQHRRHSLLEPFEFPCLCMCAWAVAMRKHLRRQRHAWQPPQRCSIENWLPKQWARQRRPPFVVSASRATLGPRNPGGRIGTEAEGPRTCVCVSHFIVGNTRVSRRCLFTVCDRQKPLNPKIPVAAPQGVALTSERRSELQDRSDRRSRRRHRTSLRRRSPPRIDRMTCRSQNG